MAKSTQRRKQKQPRLELLPVELQLAILGSLSSCEDLTSLSIASRLYHATYLRHKKIVLCQVAQATLGDQFVDACMLHHWEHNINNYTEDQDDTESSLLLQWQRSLGSEQHTGTRVETRGAAHSQPWPRGPYRHIQLKFLHDYDTMAMADAQDQAKHMRGLLTEEDFSGILTFHARVVRPLSALVAASLPVWRRNKTKGGRERTVLEARPVSSTERQRIVQTLYRFEMCCRLYAPRATPEDKGIIDLGPSHSQAMARDFFSRYDILENEEFQVVHMVVVWELHGYFGTIRNSTEWFKMLQRRYDEAELWREIIHFRHYHPITMEPVGMGGVTAGVASMGLGLLMRIESATESDGVVAELVASDPPHLSNFVWEALRALTDFYHFELDWPESWSDEFWE